MAIVWLNWLFRSLQVEIKNLHPFTSLIYVIELFCVYKLNCLTYLQFYWIKNLHFASSHCETIELFSIRLSYKALLCKFTRGNNFFEPVHEFLPWRRLSSLVRQWLQAVRTEYSFWNKFLITFKILVLEKQLYNCVYNAGSWKNVLRDVQYLVTLWTHMTIKTRTW